MTREKDKVRASRELATAADACGGYEAAWVFVCFSLAAEKGFYAMLWEQEQTTGVIRTRTVRCPPGVLWNGHRGTIFVVPRSKWPSAALALGLRKHLGIINDHPEEGGTFLLGDCISPEDGPLIEGVGLFGQLANA